MINLDILIRTKMTADTSWVTVFQDSDAPIVQHGSFCFGIVTPQTIANNRLNLKNFVDNIFFAPKESKFATTWIFPDTRAISVWLVKKYNIEAIADYEQSLQYHGIKN